MAHHSVFILRLGPGQGDASIVVGFERVASASPAKQEPRLRGEPRWLAVAAALGIVALVLLSLAAGGNVSVAPPPAPRSSPGQATPTAAPPAPRVGNLVIQAPAAPPSVPRVEPREVPAAAATPLPSAPRVAGADDSPPVVVPVPSPPADPLSVGPAALRPGSALADALRTASIANDQFNRGLHEPLPNEPQP